MSTPRKTPSDVVRNAALQMREQHGPEHKRHKMWAALADWLDGVDFYGAPRRPPSSMPEQDAAFTVARAYLEAGQ